MSMEGRTKIILPVAEAQASDQTCGQVAAFCWRRVGRKLEVLLVTSRDTGRWILPKGWPINGLTDAESALREAYEEAGVDGRPEPAPIGAFGYVKLLSTETGIPCRVDVYPIRFKRLLDDFPERKERQRRWFPLEKAALKVDEPDLRELIRAFVPPAARPAAAQPAPDDPPPKAD